MRDLYEQVKDELDTRLPEDETLPSYTKNRYEDLKTAVMTNRKVQAGLGTAMIYWYDGFMTERYGFLNRDEWHSFTIGFSDGYADGEPIGVETAEEPHYYAMGRTTGTAARDGQESFGELLDLLS